MGATRKYVVIDPATGKLDRRIFSEQTVYGDEMEKIFGRVWLMIGHGSLVPAVDDFFHTYIGEDPVILTRDGQGRLHVLNMCRHRGNRVVRVDDGNAKRFMRTYHGWTYRNDGALDHVPGESEAYYGALDRPSLGLIEARVETYAGIVFATWAKDAPSRDAYLGDAPWYLDTVFNRRDGGMQVADEGGVADYISHGVRRVARCVQDNRVEFADREAGKASLGTKRWARKRCCGALPGPLASYSLSEGVEEGLRGYQISGAEEPSVNRS